MLLPKVMKSRYSNLEHISSPSPFALDSALIDIGVRQIFNTSCTFHQMAQLTSPFRNSPPLFDMTLINDEMYPCSTYGKTWYAIGWVHGGTNVVWDRPRKQLSSCCKLKAVLDLAAYLCEGKAISKFTLYYSAFCEISACHKLKWLIVIGLPTVKPAFTKLDLAFLLAALAAFIACHSLCKHK
jgi:hypothetical protein